MVWNLSLHIHHPRIVLIMSHCWLGICQVGGKSALEREGEEIPQHLKPIRISLNKALKRQMHELHTKAREMAQETDPEKLLLPLLAIWLDMVAREEAEKNAASPQPDDGSTQPKPEEGSANMPDDGTGDDKPPP